MEAALDDNGRVGSQRCLNCGTCLSGEHCHSCGQRVHVHRNLAAFWHDLAHGVLHFEGKIWRTLPALAVRPGELTRRYVEGERARFLSPIALFLFSVFLMFAIFPVVGIGSGAAELRNTRGEVAAALRHAQADLRDIERLQNPREYRGPGTGGLRVIANRQPASLAARKAAAQRTVMLLEKAEQSAAIATGYGPRAQLPNFRALERGLNKLYENPALALYKLQSSAYKYSWALIPLSVPLLWLLFPFSNRFQLYDHTVFVTYSLSFMTLLAILSSLLMWLGVPWFVALSGVAVLAPIHIYRQLQGAYHLSRVSALWRAVLLSLFAILASASFGFLLLLIGALG